MKRINKAGVLLLLGVLALFIISIPITQGSAQCCIQPPTGLVSWWPGDGNAQDIKGCNHGSLQNGATFAAGLVGQAFSFVSPDDIVPCSLSIV